MAQAQGTLRQKSYPAAIPMDEGDIEWRQDLYREVNLLGDANVGLYSPAGQDDGTNGLFAGIFQLVLKRQLPIYKYEIEGNERLTASNKVDIVEILNDFHISYNEKSGVLTVNNSDIPYSEITTFYIREARYYNITNSTFNTKVIALCPVIVQEDEFGDGMVRYPLFWVRYSELEQFLNDIMLSSNAHNMAERMPAKDFFTLHRYEGEIYKVYNIPGRSLLQYCETDSAMAVERKRIEGYISDVRNTTYNTYYTAPGITSRKDSIATKTRYKWIFPWQKRRMQEAMNDENNK